MIGFPEVKILEKDFIELVIVILAGVNDDVVHEFIKAGHHA